MTDPRLLGTLERIAHALEEHVKLLREALHLVERLVGESDDKDPDTPRSATGGRGNLLPEMFVRRGFA